MVAFWSLLLSSIMVHAVLSSAQISFAYYILLGVVGFVAGMLIVDLERVIVGSFLSILLCTLIMFGELSLAALLGVFQHPEFEGIVYTYAVRTVFPVVFPFAAVLNVFSAVVGAYFGEKVLPNASF